MPLVGGQRVVTPGLSATGSRAGDLGVSVRSMVPLRSLFRSAVAEKRISESPGCSGFPAQGEDKTGGREIASQW